jgi:hypothetical protein
VVLAVAVLAIAGCGDDDGGDGAGGSTPAPEPDLTVEAHDIDFDSDVYELTSGEQRVAYLQEGETRHTLVVEAATTGPAAAAEDRREPSTRRHP